MYKQFVVNTDPSSYKNRLKKIKDNIKLAGDAEEKALKVISEVENDDDRFDFEEEENIEQNQNQDTT